MNVILFLGTLVLACFACRPAIRQPAMSDVEATGGNSPAAPAIAAVSSPAEFHQNISNDRRLSLISRVRIADIMSAPGHAELREPQKVPPIADFINKTGGAGFEKEPIVLGIFTDAGSGGTVSVRSIEVLDGNHRLAAGLYSGKWKVIGDIPKNYLKVVVNGWAAGGNQSDPRWIPLEVAEKSSIPRDKWFRVPDSWGPKAASAQIPGDIASIDSVIPSQYRGVPIKQVLVISLRRINVPVPGWLN